MSDVKPAHDPSGWTCPKCETLLGGSNGVCSCGYQAGQCIHDLEVENERLRNCIIHAHAELEDDGCAYRQELRDMATAKTAEGESDG